MKYSVQARISIESGPSPGEKSMLNPRAFRRLAAAVLASAAMAGAAQAEEASVIDGYAQLLELHREWRAFERPPSLGLASALLIARQVAAGLAGVTLGDAGVYGPHYGATPNANAEACTWPAKLSAPAPGVVGVSVLTACTTPWVVARLPAESRTKARSPGCTKVCIFEYALTWSMPALVRESETRTRPSSTSS